MARYLFSQSCLAFTYRSPLELALHGGLNGAGTDRAIVGATVARKWRAKTSASSN